MIWLQGIIGIMLLAGAIYGWVVLQRRFRGEDPPLIGAVKRKSKKRSNEENELEAFIAAYRAGKVDPVELESDALPLSPASAGNHVVAAAANVPRASGPASVGKPPTAPSPQRLTSGAPQGAFLRPEVKLAYLTFRSGLRDHHVFPNVRLGDLGHGVAVGTIDLLVCDTAFKYVAAIDIHVGDPPNDPPKLLFLSRAGIRHLLLSPREMPKPTALREFIYGGKD